MKDYCTWFPENWRGVYIGDCCKNHDNNCGTSNFFKCLYPMIGWHAIYIAVGGMIGCLIKYRKV